MLPYVVYVYMLHGNVYVESHYGFPVEHRSNVYSITCVKHFHRKRSLFASGSKLNKVHPIIYMSNSAQMKQEFNMFQNSYSRNASNGHLLIKVTR